MLATVASYTSVQAGCLSF